MAFERADLLDSFIDPDAAKSVLDSLAERPEATARLLFNVQCAWFYARRGRDEEAKASAAKLRSQVEFMFIGQATLCRLTEAYVAVASGAANGPELCDVAHLAAKQQGAIRWMHIAQLLKAFCVGEEEFGSAIKIIGHRSPWNVTHVADLVGRRIEDFDESVLPFIARAAAIHPGRWRFVLRERILKAPTGEGLASARLLEPIGDRSDVLRLRAYARRQRRLPGASNLGRQLARQLADRAVVEDQSRVSIVVGNRVVQGSTIRRKVLALLCFLLTRPDFSSTRDQVLDALWPELDPPDALNSLNQTVYFLRRVLEEHYVEDLSPGYLHHDSDLIWLDA